jgi:hypothetical protein
LKAHTPIVVARCRDLRQRYKLNKEMKWARVSKYHLQAYMAMFDAFVEFLTAAQDLQEARRREITEV